MIESFLLMLAFLLGLMASLLLFLMWCMGGFDKKPERAHQDEKERGEIASRCLARLDGLDQKRARAEGTVALPSIAPARVFGYLEGQHSAPVNANHINIDVRDLLPGASKRVLFGDLTPDPPYDPEVHAKVWTPGEAQVIFDKARILYGPLPGDKK